MAIHSDFFPQESTPGIGPGDNKVSKLYDYGTYSGADIKVIVHLPPDTESGKKIQQQLKVLEQQIAEMDKALAINYDLTSSEDIRQKNRFQQVRNSLSEEWAELDQQQAESNDRPTSVVLGELQTISYSVFREKTPVRTLGSVYPRAFVRGSRTIAGSMVFAVFHQHALHELLKYNLGVVNTGVPDHDRFRYSTNLIDQLPPLDISLLFANEYGAISYMGIYGVEFVQEGSTFSVEDIYSENVVQYVARDFDPMREAGIRTVDGQGVKEEYTETASGLLYKKQNFSTELNTRRNPFI
jgi:hypothetical protein